jgi:hypothetical protein
LFIPTFHATNNLEVVAKQDVEVLHIPATRCSDPVRKLKSDSDKMHKKAKLCGKT